jgi:hypothetical protein
MEARETIVVDRCRPASGLDDEDDRVAADRDPVSAAPIRQDDVASIRNGDTPNAEVESVAGTIAIAVVEYHSRGIIAASLTTGLAGGLTVGCQRGGD